MKKLLLWCALVLACLDALWIYQLSRGSMAFPLWGGFLSVAIFAYLEIAAMAAMPLLLAAIAMFGGRWTQQWLVLALLLILFPVHLDFAFPYWPNAVIVHEWSDFAFSILALVVVVVLWVVNFRLMSACVFVVAGFTLLVYLAFGAMALYPNPLSNFLVFLRVSAWQLYVVVILALLMFGLAKASLVQANQSDEDAE